MTILGPKWGPNQSSEEQPKKVKAIHEICSSTQLDTRVFSSYLEHMWTTIPEEQQLRFTCIDSLWVSMYLRGEHQKVMAWLRKGSILKQPYIFLPIVHGGHWNLLVLCNLLDDVNSSNGPCMLILDSLLSIDPLRIEPEIRRFIFDLYKVHRKSMTHQQIVDIPLLVPKVPQQTNGDECGMFVLYYMYMFIQSAPEIYSLNDSPSFLNETWFTYDQLTEFSNQIATFTLGKKGNEGGEELEIQLEQAEEIEHSESSENATKESGETSKQSEHSTRNRSRKRGGTSSHEVHGMEPGKRICVEWNNVGQPIGTGGRSLRTFLGTMARNVEKLPVYIPTWRKMPQARKDDVWEYVKRKYDIEEHTKGFVMKDLSLKWKYWKYQVRKKYFNSKARAAQQKLPPKNVITPEQWKEAVKDWCTEEWMKKSQVNKVNKGKQKWHHCGGTRTIADIRKAEYDKSGRELDRTDLFIITHTQKDAKPMNDECAAIIEKLQNLRNLQPASSSSLRPLAAKDDIYAQVLGQDHSGRVRGVGTGPTPSSLWGTTNVYLKVENVMLSEKVKDLERRFARLEASYLQQQCENVREDQDSPMNGSSSVASKQVNSDSPICEGEELLGKRVKLLDVDGQHVGNGIVMSIDKEKIVMGRQIGNAYYEVSVTYACKPDVSLYVKDHNRKKLRDALGSHILWLIDYVQVDYSRCQKGPQVQVDNAQCQKVSQV